MTSESGPPLDSISGPSGTVSCWRSGGITARLWDDPFEWTLPEELSTKAKIREHFDVVEASLLRAFAHLKDDSDLEKLIPAPEELQPLRAVIRDALALSTEHLERAADLAARDLE